MLDLSFGKAHFASVMQKLSIFHLSGKPFQFQEGIRILEQMNIQSFTVFTLGQTSARRSGKFRVSHRASINRTSAVFHPVANRSQRFCCPVVKISACSRADIEQQVSSQ